AAAVGATQAGLAVVGRLRRAPLADAREADAPTPRRALKPPRERHQHRHQRARRARPRCWCRDESTLHGAALHIYQPGLDGRSADIDAQYFSCHVGSALLVALTE